MRKILFVTALFLSVVFTVQAGYIIRGFSTLALPESSLKNYTLTFDRNGEPITAASMAGPCLGRHSIAIVQANSNFAHIFPIFINNEYLPIEVRDFHYSMYDNVYVLCGSRGTGATARAFVAIMRGDLTSLRFYEYQEANIFYSIYPTHISPVAPAPPVIDFYVCGKKDNFGVIAQINGFTLQLTNVYKAENWEYHKIILKINTGGGGLRFVVSGRNTGYTRIGYTVFAPNFSLISGYQWAQYTDPASLCVVSDYMLENDKVVLASSYGNRVILTPVTLFFTTPQTAYQFTWSSPYENIYVQDIATIVENNNVTVSVVGYGTVNTTPLQHRAWHGFVTGLPGLMTNNNYFAGNEQYEHYKVRYLNGIAYTGGQWQDNNLTRVLFGTPRTFAQYCDNPYMNMSTPIVYEPSILPVLSDSYSLHNSTSIYSNQFNTEYDACTPFKGGEPTPEFIIPIEDESEIIIYYDRITVKDIPMNINYQIYNIVGQLLQTGTTNPDISTANLNKGIYILRLENGKTFKFVR